jgi:hypothetical protein
MIRPGVALALLLSAMPAALSAQTIRGTVVTESGDPVPYAVIVLEPGFSQRFADSTGRFAIPRVAAGEYRLRARQVGYSPFDSAIHVTAASAPIRVQLARIAIRLADLRVTGDNECRNPARDTAEAGLVTVFEQLRQNAERYALLAERYPFRYRVERKLADLRRDGTEAAKLDTLELSSTARWPYEPGKVVTPEPDATDGTQFVHLPELGDFADPAFRSNHCFTYRGVQRFEGRQLIRVDFAPLPRHREPDVEGSAFLDPETYQIRHTRVSLTQLSRVSLSLAEWTSMTSFREVVPHLVMKEHIHVLTRLIDTPRSGPVIARSEDQRLLTVDFVRPLNGN